MGKTLIVDDDDDMRLLLQLKIDEANQGLHVVGQAASGEEALVIRRELDIDVIVLDHAMPGLSGVETAEALLANEPDLPIVLYSAHLDDSSADDARRIGVRQCVRKGDMRALIAALRDLTGLEITDTP